MEQSRNARVVKIGVFYDGSYFTYVTNYYKHHHSQKSRIHVEGLHEFIRKTIAEKVGVDFQLCHIIDAHFFRGRFTAREANEKEGQLYKDRIFDDILMYNNIQAHYLPLKDLQGRKKEKGIDVLMALETYELCMLKRYDVVVLIASDGDYVTLARKIHGLGCRTILLGWDFEFTDNDSGSTHYTRTSSDLWNEVTYPLKMSTVIDEGLKLEDENIQNIFVNKYGSMVAQNDEPDERENDDAFLEKKFAPDIRHTGKIMELKGGYGFIEYPNNNLYFKANDTLTRFDDLTLGQEVEFFVGLGEKGKYTATKITLLGEYKDDNPE